MELNLSKFALVFLLSFSLAGCAGPPLMLSSSAQNVKVGKSDPTDNYVEMNSISGVDGSGCGSFGYEGTYDRAIINLKNNAANTGGDYVQIFTISEPHFTPGCFVNDYKITGTLFKKERENPSPVGVVTMQSPSTLDKLRDLKIMLDEGLITKKEFNIQKAKMLSEGI